MDTDKLLRSHGIGPTSVSLYDVVAKYAQELVRDHPDWSESEVVRSVRERFVRLEDTKVPFREQGEGSPLWILGDLGTDIDYNTLEQMKNVMRIPPAIKGSLMPDGHLGYAMPIGGVVALENAVSPSFVGYDIACRMTLSILDLTPTQFLTAREQLAEDMRAVSLFGVGGGFQGGEKRDHAVMENWRWKEVQPAKTLRDKAANQLGTSGGGNHFFDALIGKVVTQEVWPSWLPVNENGEFVAIMTHSGSRGTGHNLATHYQKLAGQYTAQVARGIPRGYEWLSMDTDAGKEYWEAMQLMGLYAQANHHLIHNHFLKRSGVGQLARYENHHNFAWKEGDYYIHRKGATPAQKGKVGIIPGSAGSPSYLVEGLGHSPSLDSSSHGAGRLMSRTAAKKLHDPAKFKEQMDTLGILHFGVSADETPSCYKDVRRVIALQEGLLVRVIAEMQPTVVIMNGAKSDDGD